MTVPCWGWELEPVKSETNSNTSTDIHVVGIFLGFSIYGSVEHTWKTWSSSSTTSSVDQFSWVMLTTLRTEPTSATKHEARRRWGDWDVTKKPTLYVYFIHRGKNSKIQFLSVWAGYENWQYSTAICWQNMVFQGPTGKKDFLLHLFPRTSLHIVHLLPGPYPPQSESGCSPPGHAWTLVGRSEGRQSDTWGGGIGWNWPPHLESLW